MRALSRRQRELSSGVPNGWMVWKERSEMCVDTPEVFCYSTCFAYAAGSAGSPLIPARAYQKSHPKR